MEGTYQPALVDYKNLYLALPLGHNSDTHIYLNHLHVQFPQGYKGLHLLSLLWECQQKARLSLRLQMAVFGIRRDILI